MTSLTRPVSTQRSPTKFRSCNRRWAGEPLQHHLTFISEKEKIAFHRHHCIRWVLNIYRMEARVNENLLQTNDDGGGGFLLLLFMHRKSRLERHLATTGAGKETKNGRGWSFLKAAASHHGCKSFSLSAGSIK